jgi:hypothetical protein
MYAGNCLARDFGVLGWTRDEILKATILCYKAAQDMLPTESNRLRTSIRSMTQALRALPDSKTVDWAGLDEIPGFRERRGEEMAYLVRVEEFGRIVGDERQKAAVLQWLIARQRIVLKAKITPAEPREQFKWPDGDRRRSYEISWPAKKKSSRHT